MSKKPKPNPESLWMVSESKMAEIVRLARSILKLADLRPLGLGPVSKLVAKSPAKTKKRRVKP